MSVAVPNYIVHSYIMHCVSSVWHLDNLLVITYIIKGAMTEYMKCPKYCVGIFKCEHNVYNGI